MPWKDKPEFRRLLVFTAVGTMNTAVCYAIYAVLIHVLAWHHNPALVADYACGAMLGYAAHRLATFADRKHIRQAFGKYAATLLTTFLINLALLDALVDSRLLGPLAAQGVAMSFVTLVSYLLQKHWVFRSHDVMIEPKSTDEGVIVNLTPQLTVETSAQRRAAA